MKKVLLIIITTVLVNIFISGCQLSENYIGNEELDYSIYNNDDIVDKGPVRGGTLKLFSTTPDTLNPIFTRNIYVQRFSSLIYESMFIIEKDQSPIPVLVDKWEVSEDKLIYSFHIKEGVTWHDGMPLTAEDIEYTVKTILEGPNDSVYSKNLDNIATFAAINKNVFRIVLKRPYSFTRELMTFPIIPRRYSDKSGLMGVNGKLVPVGTGPYKFKKWAEEDCIILSVNDSWWNHNENGQNSLITPYIAEIEVNIYKNSGEEVSSFQAGDVHIACIESNEYGKYKARADIILEKYIGRDFDFIAFNTSKPPLSEKEVRQAIASAVDWQKLINDIMGDKVFPAEFPLVPGAWLYDYDEPVYKQDRNKSKKLLEENGWKEKNGVLYKRINGKNEYLNLELLVNEDNRYRILIAEKLAEQLKEIGINVEIKKMEWKEERKKIVKREFDMVLIGYRTPTIPDISYMYASRYISPYINPQFADGVNLAAYSNEKVDSYLEEIFKEDDDNRKKALFFNMAEIIKEDVPYIGLCFYNNGMIYNKNLRGDLSPYVWDLLYNIKEWYIPER